MNKKDLRQGHRRMRVEKELDFLRDVQDGESPFVENTISMFEVSVKCGVCCVCFRRLAIACMCCVMCRLAALRTLRPHC